MATEEIKQEETPDYLGMSDEEISKVDIGAVSLQANEAPVAAAADPATDQDDAADTPAEAAVEPDKDDAGEDKDEAADTKVTAPDSTDSVTADADTPSPELDKEKPKESSEEAFDYKAAYERLTAPFKANGKEMVVESVDDAITLMKMGANYNKKMAALKPNLKVLKLLENNGLLSEEKLSYLIDLDKKDPAAISKLIKDSGIDPLDISAEGKEEYKPKKHTVADVELELDAVLDEIQETPTYTRTLKVVSEEWDAPSKKIIANSPQILTVINNHMQSGIYDLIQTEMEKERVFGRLNGLSDIEAYRQVGDAIQARGGFDHLGHQGQPAPKPLIVEPKPKPADDDKLKEKKRAASTSKPAGPNAVPADFNPLALSDEEFSKQINGKYL